MQLYFSAIKKVCSLCSSTGAGEVWCLARGQLFNGLTVRGRCFLFTFPTHMLPTVTPVPQLNNVDAF